MKRSSLRLTGVYFTAERGLIGLDGEQTDDTGVAMASVETIAPLRPPAHRVFQPLDLA